MADDKVVSGSLCLNGEKVHQTGACNVNLNLTDEVTASTEYIRCPEFQFAVS